MKIWLDSLPDFWEFRRIAYVFLMDSVNLDISPEKDIVLTLVPDSLTNKVMDAIGQGINIDIPGNGICFSIDVDKVIGITKIHQYREIIGMQELLDENNDREKSES